MSPVFRCRTVRLDRGLHWCSSTRRSIARHDENADPGASKKDVLDRRLLAEGVAAALRGSPSRYILVVSARNGDGKSHLFHTLESVLAVAEPQAWTFLDLASAAGLSPTHFPAPVRVLIDGASLLDGDGGIDLGEEWMNALDGALIVLLAGRTTENEVAQLRNRLDALEIPPVGVVWNDRDDRGLPSLLGALRRRASAVRQIFPGNRAARAEEARGPAVFLRPVRQGSAS
jgi:Mrp family chromosome partitioning ATPase